MAREYDRIIRQDKQPAAYAVDKSAGIAAFEIGAAYTASEQSVARQQKVAVFAVQTDASA